MRDLHGPAAPPHEVRPLQRPQRVLHLAGRPSERLDEVRLAPTHRALVDPAEPQKHLVRDALRRPRHALQHRVRVPRHGAPHAPERLPALPRERGPAAPLAALPPARERERREREPCRPAPELALHLRRDGRPPPDLDAREPGWPRDEVLHRRHARRPDVPERPPQARPERGREQRPGPLLPQHADDPEPPPRPAPRDPPEQRLEPRRPRPARRRQIEQRRPQRVVLPRSRSRLRPRLRFRFRFRARFRARSRARSRSRPRSRSRARDRLRELLQRIHHQREPHRRRRAPRRDLRHACPRELRRHPRKRRCQRVIRPLPGPDQHLHPVILLVHPLAPQVRHQPCPGQRRLPRPARPLQHHARLELQLAPEPREVIVPPEQQPLGLCGQRRQAEIRRIRHPVRPLPDLVEQRPQPPRRDPPRRRIHRQQPLQQRHHAARQAGWIRREIAQHAAQRRAPELGPPRAHAGGIAPVRRLVRDRLRQPARGELDHAHGERVRIGRGRRGLQLEHLRGDEPRGADHAADGLVACLRDLVGAVRGGVGGLGGGGALGRRPRRRVRGARERRRRGGRAAERRGAVGAAGDPEIEHLDGAVAGQEQVGGLEIEVDDAAGVDDVEGPGDVAGPGEDAAPGDTAAGPLEIGERAALQELHGDERGRGLVGGRAAEEAGGVDGHEGRVPERGEELGFLRPVRGRREPGDEELEGDVPERGAVGQELLGAPHVAEAAAPQACAEAVAAVEDLSGAPVPDRRERDGGGLAASAALLDEGGIQRFHRGPRYHRGPGRWLWGSAARLGVILAPPCPPRRRVRRSCWWPSSRRDACIRKEVIAGRMGPGGEDVHAVVAIAAVEIAGAAVEHDRLNAGAERGPLGQSAGRDLAAEHAEWARGDHGP